VTTTNSTAYSRDLGDELRRLRQRFTGLRGRAMAIQLGWDPSKVSNIEHGKIRASAVDLAQYLTVCGKDIDFFEDFLNRYRNAFDPYLVQDPDNQRTLAMTEAAATKITAYDVISIHPLLHTPAYARALQAATAHPLQDPVETLDRQTVMRRPTHPECTFYVHELALRIRLGDTRVMQDQYERLLAESNIVRIIPAEATSSVLHPKCTLYEFENAAPLVYAESDVAKVFAQDDTAVTRCRTLFDHLETVALNEHQTRRILTQHVQALGAPVRALTRTQ
jgi:transcriptional regulator with XRE-family HTH domain